MSRTFRLIPFSIPYLIPGPGAEAATAAHTNGAKQMQRARWQGSRRSGQAVE
jgi:hypothetical protein